MLMSLLVTRESFLNRYNKPKTKTQAKIAFVAFDKFLKFKKVEEPDILTRIRNGENPYLILDDLVQFWKQDKHPTTIKNYFQFIKDWFRYNDISIEDYKVKHTVKFPKPIRDRVVGIDRDIIKQLLNACTKPIYRSYLIVLVSSGMRKNECLNMRPSWISIEKVPKEILIPGKYTKTGQERITFLTNEAWKSIQPFMKKDDSRIFPMSDDSVGQYIGVLRKRCGLMEKGSNGFYHVRLHKIRGFTENKVSKSSSPEVAHALLGHTKDLIQYFQGGTTDKEFAEDYSKAIPYLTIEEDNILKDENENLREQVKKQTDLERQVLALQDQMKRMQQLSQAPFSEHEKQTGKQR